jgi:branched-chain amino acid transport system substrate-binding protein
MKFLSLKPKVRAGAMAIFWLLAAQSRAAKSPRERIGVVVSLTGSAAELGKDTRAGIEKAFAELKGEGRASWELVFEDDASDAGGAITAVRHLLAGPGVRAIIGPLAAATVNAVAPLVEAAHVPLITPTATHATVTTGRAYIFRVALDDESQAAALGRYAHRSLGAASAAILIDSGSEAARRQAAAFARSFKQAGGRPPHEESYAPGTLDFTPLLKKLLPLRPDVVFLPGTASEAGRAVAQAQAAKLQSNFIGGETWDDPKFFELAGGASIGHVFAAHFSVQDPDIGTAAFVRAYSLAQGKPPSPAVALGYDATRLLAEALAISTSAPSNTPGATHAAEEAGPALRTALEKMRAFPAVTGSLTIGTDHVTRKPLIVRETQKDRATFKARTE